MATSSPKDLIRKLLTKNMYDMVSIAVIDQQQLGIDKYLDSTPHSDKHVLFLKIQNEIKYQIILIKVEDWLNNMTPGLLPSVVLDEFNKQLDEIASETLDAWTKLTLEKVSLGDSAENVLAFNIKAIYGIISANVKPVLTYPAEVSSNQNFAILSSQVKHSVINDKIMEVVSPKLKAKQSTKEVMELMVDLIDNTSLVNDIVLEIQKQLEQLVTTNVQ